MNWNYLQLEVATGNIVHPTIGPGGMTRERAHAFVLLLLQRYAEGAPYAAGLVEAWTIGAQDDTVYAAQFVWAIYEADDPREGAKAWVDDLATTLRRSGSRIRIAW